MPDVSINDVDEAAAFYADLLKFNSALEEWFHFIWPRLVNLGSNWRDPQYERLYETLDEHLRPGMLQYQEIAEDVANELRRQVNLIYELMGKPGID